MPDPTPYRMCKVGHSVAGLIVLHSRVSLATVFHLPWKPVGGSLIRYASKSYLEYMDWRMPSMKIFCRWRLVGISTKRGIFPTSQIFTFCDVIRVEHEGGWTGHGAVSARRNEVREMLVVLQQTSNVEADMTSEGSVSKDLNLQMPSNKVQPGAWMRRLMFDRND